MDRQRRAPAVIALGRSRAASRSRRVLFSLSMVAVVAISLAGCRNRKEEARQRAELTMALDQFKAQIGELQKQASVLRVRFDKLPEDLPGIGTVRDDLHALEEVIGVEDGRAKWLAGKLDAAFASGKKEEIEAVRNAIPRGNNEIEQLVVKVTHELLPFERLGAQRRFFEALDAAKGRDVTKQRPPKAP
jgi:gamma-glutamylcysteine synthetase